MEEQEIKDFWHTHPCGESLIGGIEKFETDYQAFFENYDKFRYTKEAHILNCLNEIDFQGKKVLEIGLGQGADAEQIIRRGADWFGVDLTRESVKRVQIRMKLHDLRFGIAQASVLAMPFKPNTFDIVFSHGVLHHVPEIEKAQAEIHRVLHPNGELIMMLYAKNSLNYLLSISIIRRLGLLGIYLTGKKADGIIGQHLKNAREKGIWNYLKMDNFIHRNTDGPLNPYTKVYDLKEVEKDFPLFKVEKVYKNFMHAPPLAVSKLPFEKSLGWHLWVHLRPRKR
jgi:ubiquinone/menaquinone biosynthesis C-methylase UbiE